MADIEKTIKALKDWKNDPLAMNAEIDPCLVDDALALLKEQQQQIWDLQDQVEYLTDKLKEQEAVEGHWIPIESPTGVEAFGIKEMTVQDVRCSICDAEEDVSFATYRFCPRCGAKMEGR